MKEYFAKVGKNLGKFAKAAGKLKILQKTRVVIIVLLILAVLYLAKGVFVAAVVNGVPIFHYSLVKELERQGGKNVLDSLITEKLIYQEASKNKVEISKDDVSGEISLIEDQLKKQGMDLDTALSLQGQTRGDLEKNLEIKLIIEKLMGDKLSVADSEIKDYFDKNQSLYKGETLDQVRNEIITVLKQQKLSSLYQTWIGDIKQKSKILYFLNF
jgi:foldase protein PrsA